MGCVARYSKLPAAPLSLARAVQDLPSSHVDRRPELETAADVLAFRRLNKLNDWSEQSLRVAEVLFELSHFIRASAVDNPGTHPYPFQRYLNLAAMTDESAYAQPMSRLHGEWATFWYLAPDRS